MQKTEVWTCLQQPTTKQGQRKASSWVWTHHVNFGLQKHDQEENQRWESKESRAERTVVFLHVPRWNLNFRMLLLLTVCKMQHTLLVWTTKKLRNDSDSGLPPPSAYLPLTVRSLQLISTLPVRAMHAEKNGQQASSHAIILIQTKLRHSWLSGKYGSNELPSCTQKQLWCQTKPGTQQSD